MLKSKNKLLHKALAFVLTFSLLAALVSFNFTANAVTGEGTAANPYEISNETDLTEFKTKVENGESGAYAKLTASFTINVSWTPIGGSDASTKYTGVFDGGNCTITFSSMTDGEYVGLFASNAGTIKNLTVASTATDNIIATKLAFVGGIAGENSGNIVNCSNDISFSANGKNTVVGGITAVSSGKVSNCKNTSDTTGITTATSDGTIVDKEATVGGIVGLNLNGTVEKSTNNSAISNTDSNGYAGGIVGCNYGTINNCLNTVSVNNNNSSQYAGGIAGYLFKDEGKGDATISNSLNTIESGNIIGSNGLTDNSHIGTITNCYYKGTDDNIDGTTPVTDLTSGDIAYKLNNGNVSAPVWGQKIQGENTDNYPVIGITEEKDNIVYNNESTYTNRKPQCTKHQYENGVCIVCGEIGAKLVGYNLVDKGIIGINYYYNISEAAIPSGETPKVTFTINNEEKVVDGEAITQQNGANYKFTLKVNSDEMSRDINAVLNVGEITVTNNNYSVANYLESLYLDPTDYLDSDNLDKAAELQNLSKAMLTYDYYANMYFKYYEDLNLTMSEPNIGLSELDSSDEILTEISDYKPTIDSDQSNSALKHTSTTLQLLDETYLRNIVIGSYNGEVYVGCKKTTENTYTYSAAKKSSDGYWGATPRIPAAELDSKYEMFFSYAENEESKLSVVKTSGPYSYVYTIINAYKDTTGKEDVVNLVKALYNYGKAAKAYYA